MKKMRTKVNLSILYVPRAKKNKVQKMDRLYARITVNGERVEISTGRTMPQKLFNVKAQRCLGKTKEARQINQFIDSFSYRINEIRHNISDEGFDVTAESIKRVYNGLPPVEEKPKPKIIEFYEAHNKRLKSLIDIDVKYATVERHITSKKHLHNFIQYQYNKNDMEFEDINFKFVTNYEHYLKIIRKCQHNTTMKYIKNFGKIIRLAISEEIIHHNPLDKFKVTFKQVNREVLTHEEIKRLNDLKITDQRLDRVRDLFLFCIYTGLAFIDMKGLRMKDIIQDSDGTKWIKGTRTKTEISFMIPLMDVPLKLIDKHSNDPRREKDGIVIPALTNQKYNAYLKELAVMARINKNLTSHIARHTFATTITLNEGVPLEVVSKMLGHSNTRTTQLYAKVHQKAIKDSMKKFMHYQVEEDN